MNRIAEVSFTILLIATMLISAMIFLSFPSAVSASSTVARLYSVNTVVNRGTEVTSHNFSHASDDSWYQIDSVSVGAKRVIDVEMLFSTTEDPNRLIQIYVFSEVHVTDGARPVDIKIYNYVTLLWEPCFNVSATSDTDHQYYISANFTHYISNGEMKLRVRYSVKAASQSIYQDHTYIELTPGRPVASFTFLPEAPLVNETVAFNASESYDPDGTIVNYAWDFGDNTPPINESDPITTHTYTTHGTYTVNLTVTDNNGLSDTTSRLVIIYLPPVAIFTFLPEAPLVNETVAFNASESYDPDGTIVSYSWDFGDGAYGEGETPYHPYSAFGVYNVTLTVTDSDNHTDTTAQTVTVYAPPVAIFTYSPQTPLTGEAVTFNATASYDPDGTVVSYQWDFGDGANGTGKIAAHTYADNGNYTVMLNVTDNNGLSDITSINIAVLNRPPVAIFTESATTVLTGEVIYFNASDSHDPDGTIVNYFWDFGDGSNASGAAVSHSYEDDGNYTVILTVTDDDGATDSSTAIKIATNRPPVATFTESGETALTAETIHFNASDSYDPDGSIQDYLWDFGDGTNATGLTVDHAYADDGIYTVTLTVTDDDGAQASASATKTIINRAPVASFTESATTAPTGQTIHLNASESYDPDGYILSYLWDFGDGTNATGVTAEHAYSDNGTYLVTLTVVDDDEASASTSATKTVLNRPPIALFAESAEAVFTGEVIYFNASQSYDPDGYIVGYFWDFGDGTNATGVTAEHSYTEDGTYTVTLTTNDDDGASSSTSATKTISNRPPIASFTESAETVHTGEAILFNATDSYDPDGTIANYFWSFGDGSNASGNEVTHAYADNGNYTVTLTVTDNDGSTGTATATKTVLNRAPVAAFTESAQTVSTAEEITFNASSSYDLDGVVTNYFWDFGDGGNATGIIVGHSYEDDGAYTVTLTVTDDDGATDTAASAKTVLNRPPTALFTESAETVYTGEAVYFNASGSYDMDGIIVSYWWDFGDGGNATGMLADHFYVDDGNYTVTLTVTDNDGSTGTATATKTVLNRAPVAAFTESAETAYTGEAIAFNASDSYDSDGSIVGYFWDFGDNSNATGVTVEHAYPEDGIYTVTLTVTDNDGATTSSSTTKTVLNRPPIAFFFESAETVLTGEAIAFNASDSYDSDGSIVGYFWDFGDNSNATGLVTEHSYMDDGGYTVTLTVTDNDGASASTSAIKTVLNRPPVATFTESAEVIYTNEAISFDAGDSYDLDGSVVGYFWDFGDGTNASGVAADHSYPDDGNYTVTLMVTDDDGENNTATATKTVLNRPPVALFSESTETVLTGETITFNASASYDLDGYITSYSWDFGDGTTGTGSVVGHAYIDNGIYTVKLVVTDNDGATASVNASKNVLNRPPVAIFTESAETVLTGQAITFNATGSYDSDGYVASYLWDFGDGTSAAGVTAEHAYPDNGLYNVTLTVTDDDGATTVTSAAKSVLNRPPIAAFAESAESSPTGEAITFNASESYDSDGYVVSYLWDFGDGTNGTGMVVAHAYDDDGAYTVTLTLADDDGATASASALKTILNKAPLPSFTESAETVFTNETITFDASDTYDPDGYIVSHFWEFGDGANATGTIVDHAYTDDGLYIVTLTATDDDGATASASTSKTVLNRPPVAEFTYSPLLPLVNETVKFNASASYDPDGTIISYLWDFGDGNNATGMIVTHAYPAAGNYTVTLSTTDNDGKTDTTTYPIQIGQPPVASFTYTPTVPYRGDTVIFNASSSLPRGGVIVGYTWDFGDDSPPMTTADPIAAHVYTAWADYTVTLTVMDSEGLNDTASEVVTIARAPIAIFTHSPEFPIAFETITFNATNSYDPNGYIVSYLWDFGDGRPPVNTTNPVATHAYWRYGNYTATLTVSDNNGYTDTSTASIRIRWYPSASFTYTPDRPVAGESVTFNASDSNPNGGVITSYQWDFGDDNLATVTDPIVYHTYSPGNYTVTLNVSDSEGLTNSVTKTITVDPGPPEANFTWAPALPTANQTVIFDASASIPNNIMITSYLWDFGDGFTDLILYNWTATHEYTSHGSYTVTLTVTNMEGLNDTVSKNVTITDYPHADFTWSPQDPQAYETITFDALLSTPNGGTIITYTWNFGDGNVTVATDPTTTHYYATPGNYTVTLTVLDTEGLSDTISQTISVSVAAEEPRADFTYSPLIPYIYEIINFNASTSTPGVGTIVAYTWNFGDGNIIFTTDPIITHAYQDSANYSITLTVTNIAGLTDTTSKPIEILPVSGPTASFTWSPLLPQPNKTVAFDASSSTAGWNGSIHPPIISWQWDFGDGNITVTTQSTIIHIYTSTGDFTVTLVVTDINGLTDNKTKTIKVTELEGDLNGDGKVDIRDIVTVALAFGSRPGDPNWNPIADITGPDGEPDGQVDIRDIVYVALRYGNTLQTILPTTRPQPSSNLTFLLIIESIIFNATATMIISMAPLKRKRILSTVARVPFSMWTAS